MSSQTSTLVTEFETDVVVTAIKACATDVVELTLETPTGRPLPPWTPGAHIDVFVADDLVRQYSLCGPLRDGAYKIAVLLAPDSRGGSRGVHGLSKGATVRIRGPRNNFPMIASRRYLFIAGGIGITPILPMIAEAEAADAEWHLYYGGRSAASMAYRDRLAAYPDRVTLVPQDTDGLLDIPGILRTPHDDTLIYCCGPEPLLAAVEEHSAHWPNGSLHLERFSAKTVDRDGEDEGFELVLQRSGITIPVNAEQSVFDAMRGAGVSVLGSCLEGICGTCETGVLEGEVDHRDSVLDPDEQEAMDCMMVCVSRSKSDRLVLDA